MDDRSSRTESVKKPKKNGSPKRAVGPRRQLEPDGKKQSQQRPSTTQLLKQRKRFRSFWGQLETRSDQELLQLFDWFTELNAEFFNSLGGDIVYREEASLRLLASAQFIEATPGEIIYQVGDDVHDFYFVLAGRVAIATTGTRDINFRTIAWGHTCGTEEILAGVPTRLTQASCPPLSETDRAMPACNAELLKIPSAEFADILGPRARRTYRRIPGFLRNVVVFNHLGNDLVNSLAAYCHRQNILQGRCLLRDTYPTHDVIFVLKGSFVMSLEGVVCKELKAGSILIGNSALCSLAERKRLRVMAQEDSVVLYLRLELIENSHIITDDSVLHEDAIAELRRLHARQANYVKSLETNSGNSANHISDVQDRIFLATVESWEIVATRQDKDIRKEIKEAQRKRMVHQALMDPWNATYHQVFRRRLMNARRKKGINRSKRNGPNARYSSESGPTRRHQPSSKTAARHSVGPSSQSTASEELGDGKRTLARHGATLLKLQDALGPRKKTNPQAKTRNKQSGSRSTHRARSLHQKTVSTKSRQLKRPTRSKLQKQQKVAPTNAAAGPMSQRATKKALSPRAKQASISSRERLLNSNLGTTSSTNSTSMVPKRQETPRTRDARKHRKQLQRRKLQEKALIKSRSQREQQLSDFMENGTTLKLSWEPQNSSRPTTTTTSSTTSTAMVSENSSKLPRLPGVVEDPSPEQALLAANRLVKQVDRLRMIQKAVGRLPSLPSTSPRSSSMHRSMKSEAKRIAQQEVRAENLRFFQQLEHKAKISSLRHGGLRQVNPNHAALRQMLQSRQSGANRQPPSYEHSRLPNLSMVRQHKR